MKDFERNNTAWGRLCVLLGLLVLLAVAPVSAQKNKDKKKDTSVADSAAASTQTKSLLSDSQLIDQTVGECLGYWQIGDTASMHKYYSDSVVVVSGAWEQPVIGWDNYMKAYQAQRSQVNNGRLDRSNIYTKVDGNSAWTTYQWEYTGSVQGQPFGTRGHTTLVLNKQGDRWVIVLDHSSVVSGAAGPSSSSAPARP